MSQCDPIVGRQPCVDALKEKACDAGADTVYGFQEGNSGGFMFIAATLANRTNGQTPSAGTSGCYADLLAGVRLPGRALRPRLQPALRNR